MPGAVREGEPVQLCWTEGSTAAIGRAWVIGPAALVLQSPLTLFVRHGESGDDVHLFVPGRNGATRRAFDEAKVGADGLQAMVYRPGSAFVARDARDVMPYDVPREADVLLIVDNSCSMADEQATLSEAYATMHESMVALEVDFRVAVTSTDMDGSFGPNGSRGALREITGARFVDGSTPSPTQIFAAMVQMGVTGSATERGIAAAKAAWELPANASVFRVGAALSIVFFSDDANTRRGRDPTVEELVEALPSGAVAHAIVSLDRGADYLDAAQRTGGVVADISSRRAIVGALAGIVEQIDRDTSFRLPEGVDPVELEAWWVPPGREPERIARADVTYDPERHAIKVRLGERPRAEVVLLF